MGGYGLSTASGKTIHLRSLDWEEHAPISKFPAVAIYHPTEPNSVPFSNIAWVGFLGCLTCYNSQHVGIGERLGDAPNKD